MIKVLFFDREDVLHFGREFPRDVVTLSPSAFAAAEEARIFSIKNPKLSATDHARCVVAGQRALLEFDHSVLQIDLLPAVALIARQALWGQACLVHRLRSTLPQGPWMVRDSTGKWVQTADWLRLQEVILPRIWNEGVKDRAVKARPPPLAALHRILTRAAALLSRGRSNSWIAMSTLKQKNGLREALDAVRARIALFEPTHGGWVDYKTLIRGFRNNRQIQRFQIAPFPDDDVRVLRTLESLRDIGAFISDAHVRSAWLLYEQYLARSVPAVLAMVAEGSAVMQALRVRSAVSYEANSVLAAALLGAAGVAGVRRFVFNHNSQPPSGSAIADSVLKTLFQQRTWNQLVDVAALWSPASQQRSAGCRTRGLPLKAVPVRVEYSARTNLQTINRPFRILHAGNYQNWCDFFPWIAETADEYMRGLQTLATIVEQLDGIELIVRVRPKREVDLAAVETHLGTRRNVTVCGTDQDFLVQLADSDLLVCHFSTTVEQALQMGKPVLLWGSTARYRQFEAQESLPSDTSRSAVYTVRDAENLPAMLTAIRDAHRGNALSTNETSCYRFVPDTPGLASLASLMVRADICNKTEKRVQSNSGIGD